MRPSPVHAARDWGRVRPAAPRPTFFQKWRATAPRLPFLLGCIASPSRCVNDDVDRSPIMTRRDHALVMIAKPRRYFVPGSDPITTSGVGSGVGCPAPVLLRSARRKDDNPLPGVDRLDSQEQHDDEDEESDQRSVEQLENSRPGGFHLSLGDPAFPGGVRLPSKAQTYQASCLVRSGISRWPAVGVMGGLEAAPPRAGRGLHVFLHSRLRSR